MLTINCKGTLIDLSIPKVMGILNLTPDSFYDGGKNSDEKIVLKQVEKMLSEGAAFIDLGGYSSRPGAEHITENEEENRVLPALEAILKHFPETLISIDTFRSGLAAKAIDLGACMINDISAGNLDKNMFHTVASRQVPYVAMHMPGTPGTMLKMTHYDDLVTDLVYFFSKKISELRELHINDIIIDVGFGFGKTLEQNYTLLKKLEVFHMLGVPILTGISRKSMVYKIIGTDPEQALNGTTVANTLALLKGSNILRVHDVKEAVEAVKITRAYV